MPVLSEKKRSVDAPSKYVVELNAGSSRTFGIEKGDTLVVKGPLPEGV